MWFFKAKQPIWLEHGCSLGTDKAYRMRQKAIRAVNKLTDQATLAIVVKSAHHYLIREAAAKNLTDPVTLASLATQPDICNYSRKIIIEKLTDQEVLAEIAKNDLDISLRELAVSKLTDPTLRNRLQLDINKDKAEIAFEGARLRAEAYERRTKNCWHERTVTSGGKRLCANCGADLSPGKAIF